jgi:hypothetical protein
MQTTERFGEVRDTTAAWGYSCFTLQNACLGLSHSSGISTSPSSIYTATAQPAALSKLKIGIEHGNVQPFHATLHIARDPQTTIRSNLTSHKFHPQLDQLSVKLAGDHVTSTRHGVRTDLGHTSLWSSRGSLWSTVHPTDTAVPKISLTVPDKSLAQLRSLIIRAISMMSSNEILPLCLTFFSCGWCIMETRHDQTATNLRKEGDLLSLAIRPKSVPWPVQTVYVHAPYPRNLLGTYVGRKSLVFPIKFLERYKPCALVSVRRR